MVTDIDLVPVVESCAPDSFVIGSKAQFAYQMQRRECGGAKAGDVAGVWRNLGLDQGNVQAR